MTLVYTELTGYGLRLREWRETDAETFRTGMNDPEVRRWDGMTDGPLDEAETLRRIRARAEGWERGDLAPYCVEDGGTGEVLGSVEVHRIDVRRACGGVGYWLMPGARGRGVATRAVELCTRWGFEQLGLHRLELGHATANEPSCRVALRTGYVAEGVARGALLVPGGREYADMHVHARLATDPAPRIG